MLIATRILATLLVALSFAFGWPLLYSSMMGYIWIAVPALLAAWMAAWFGDEVADLIGIGSDGLIRGFGLCILAVLALVVAAGRWHWFR